MDAPLTPDASILVTVGSIDALGVRLWRVSDGASIGQIDGTHSIAISPASAESHRVEGWSAFWNAWISAAFLQTYLQRAASCSFLSPEPAARRLMLGAFLLQKAVYEISYELNNRPDWVRIPLRGILSLVA